MTRTMAFGKQTVDFQPVSCWNNCCNFAVLRLSVWFKLFTSGCFKMNSDGNRIN